MIYHIPNSKIKQTNKQSTDDEKFSFRATTRTKTRIEKKFYYFITINSIWLRCHNQNKVSASKWMQFSWWCSYLNWIWLHYYVVLNLHNTFNYIHSGFSISKWSFLSSTSVLVKYAFYRKCCTHKSNELNPPTTGICSSGLSYEVSFLFHARNSSPIGSDCFVILSN
jgi:hypothetical protein